MDLAYDHIQEDSLSPGANAEQQSSLNEDLQEAYKAFSASPWGARIGGFLGTVVNKGGSVYNEAQQEFSALSQDATKGFTDLRDSIINRTRSLSLSLSPDAEAKEAEAGVAGEKDDQSTPTRAGTSEAGQTHEATVLERLRTEAAKRLRDFQRAEDAADEALLKFGSQVRDFLRDAISIAPPQSDAPADQPAGGVLFESKDAQGKRVIHASRYDAQLHVVHTSAESLAKDPAGDEYDAWARGFDVECKTDDIAADLAAYPELRVTMEKLVPDQVTYADFWKRYYFLRHGIETAEARRRDLLRAASAEDDVKWDDDSDESAEDEEKEDEDSDDDAEDDDETDDDAATTTAPPKGAAAVGKAVRRPPSTSSSTTIHPPKQLPVSPDQKRAQAAPAESRRSNDEKSQADSDASYDVVGAASGAPSHAPGSPKNTKKPGAASDDDDSDDSDEDWE